MVQRPISAHRGFISLPLTFVCKVRGYKENSKPVIFTVSYRGLEAGNSEANLTSRTYFSRNYFG